MKLSKSKLALAEVINENGGWPQDSEWAVQNGDHGRISFSINKPVRHDSKSWMAKGGFNLKIEVCKPLKNWHQNVLSREEYYQAYPKADADGWIEWNGAPKSPVDKGAAVDVKLRYGIVYFGQLINDERWGDHWGEGSIALYRLHKPDVKHEFRKSLNLIVSGLPVDVASFSLHSEPTKVDCGESVTRSIPEPEAKPTIERLAADYRNAKDYALRLQEEANNAWTAAEKAKGELIDAGRSIGIDVQIITAKQEPELVITNRSQLELGDVIWLSDSTVKENNKLTPSGEYMVVKVGVIGVQVDGQTIYPDFSTREWRFIRRP